MAGGNDHLAALTEKLATFLETQRRIVTEFERSLANSRHFLELANLSMEREPENTVAMLRQILEIDLVGHLENQFETFESMEQVLPGEAGPSEISAGEWEELRQRYRELLEEAQQQRAETENLLHAIEGNG